MACINHRLNWKINTMMEEDDVLADVLDRIRKDMLEFKSKLTNRGALQNLVSLNPVRFNKTRWTGKYLMLARFLCLCEKMIVVSINLKILYRNPSSSHL